MPCSAAALASLLLTAFLPHLVHSLRVDNEIIGEPEIQCGSDSVEMQFRTERPFRGKVYVKGAFHVPGCKEDYSTGIRGSRPTAGIVIGHGKCQMDRQRMITPDHGMQFSTVVVISFHPTFITQMDRAFKIKCMYRELTRTVQSEIGVSEMSTSTVTHQFPMPTCRYTIHKDSLDGELLRYARVGDVVVHRWECSSDVYGILVHSCFVEDGQGEKVMVVNENGCHVDDYVLGDPTYAEALNLAYREAHVIKFADRVNVRYQCQIKLCMKADQGCRGITPPSCNAGQTSFALDVASRLQNSREYKISRDYSREYNASREREVSEAAPLDKVDQRMGLRGILGRGSLERPPRRFFAKRVRRETQDDFNPIDGDFISQMFYVLDSTEEPEKGDTPLPQAGFYGTGVVTRDGSGGQERSICLSLAVFALLMAGVGCVFVAGGFISVTYCVRRYNLAWQKGHWFRNEPPIPSPIAGWGQK